MGRGVEILLTRMQTFTYSFWPLVVPCVFQFIVLLIQYIGEKRKPEVAEGWSSCLLRVVDGIGLGVQLFLLYINLFFALFIIIIILN